MRNESNAFPQPDATFLKEMLVILVLLENILVGVWKKESQDLLDQDRWIYLA